MSGQQNATPEEEQQQPQALPQDSTVTAATTAESSANPSIVPDSSAAASPVSSSNNTAEPTSTTADVASALSQTATGASGVMKSAADKSSSEAANAVSQHKSAGKSSSQIRSAHSTSRPETAESKRANGGSGSPSPSPSGGGGGGTGANAAGGSSHRRKRMKLGELNLSEAKIGFLGAGKMAESTINGLIHYARISPKRIHVAAPSSKGLERFKALGCRVTKRNYDIFGRYDCDIVFLCFHGYVIKHCYKLGGNRPHPLTTNYIPHQRHPVYILSLVSGVSLSQIKACLLNPESNNRYVIEIHRIMMNTAVGHGLGICAIDCEPDSKKLSPPLRQLLSAIAQLEHVPASQMDAACAIGGSGLAFAYYFINSLADGAFKMGLSRDQAIKFASKTAQCASQTMLESGKHPAELRDNVSSPSGAAIYGIHVLEKNDVASGVTAAVEAAHKRANDLATMDVAS